ncbi:MAG TPA: cyclodeaminase/cyclohydrolase family protein [Chloroflexota bacterium]|nr:cyclodeaminase/cyclohydrolase family protein [Chloroflexota bacterium]
MFVADLAAGTPVPGGGSAAAMVGTLAAALAAMVGRFTIGRKRFAAVTDAATAAVDLADQARADLLALLDEDAIAYAGVVEAQKLPRDTDEQKAERSRLLQRALTVSARVPLRIAERCAALLPVTAEMARIGNPNLISDAGVASVLAEAGLQAAALNVRANLFYISDASTRATMKAELANYLRDAPVRRDEVLALVTQRLGDEG